MEAIVLGSGSARPIPREDRCDQCRSKDPRDHRWPSALLIDGKFLIDAPPQILDLLSLIRVDPRKIRGIITTHDHADAAEGLKFFPKKIINYPLSIIHSFKIPHGQAKTLGFLINDNIAYFSDYSDITSALPALKIAKITFLDGSGWDRVFPSHQPMEEVIPIVKKLKNLRQIYFTHNGHTHLPHAKLEKMVQKQGGQRFKIAYHGMEIKI